MSTDNDNDKTQKNDQQKLIGDTRLECILASLQALLPVGESGEPETGFILILAKNEGKACTYGAFSNLTPADKDSILKGLLDKKPDE